MFLSGIQKDRSSSQQYMNNNKFGLFGVGKQICFYKGSDQLNSTSWLLVEGFVSHDSLRVINQIRLIKYRSAQRQASMHAPFLFFRADLLHAGRGIRGVATRSEQSTHLTSAAWRYYLEC